MQSCEAAVCFVCFVIELCSQNEYKVTGFRRRQRPQRCVTDLELALPDGIIWSLAYTIKPDGTGVRRRTFARGNDAHQAWSPDGEHIAFATTRMGFKDEMTYTDAPQPYGEIFVMRYDGTELQQLTDNQWEDGTLAWQPGGRSATER